MRMDLIQMMRIQIQSQIVKIVGMMKMELKKEKENPLHKLKYLNSSLMDK